MRKEQKKQVESMVALLAEAHTEIKHMLESNNVSVAQALLAQCQECAISLGTVIEAAEGEDANTIPLLEDYCELAYQLHQELSDEGNYSADKMYEELQKHASVLENSVKSDIKVRKEVVFLPYKASMWDSLESVWKAADEDPDCDAYVVPIPYYDKNPSGSFKEFHYEGDLYPEYVPVTDYRTFSLAEHKPDTIFIHNPYDECNYVTSIHPQFYSARLKEYTDKLVYIPYFVLGDIDPENEEAVEGMAHFCTLPGVLNADKVIVQSEDMRQAYIKVLLNFVKGSTRAYWEERILGLGSPKLDKVQNTRQEDLIIPEDWLRIIEKPDGSWKKIILYNTSVSALLKHDDKMLAKMRDVFRIFYENRDEVALLWRPHPLIKATIESMRPHLWKEYEKIVAEYREAGWGIYDDTAELDRAIGMADAYYGDPSSVVQLVKNAQKHFMIQNVYILNENCYSLAMENVLDCGDKWLFFAYKQNALYALDKEKLVAEVVLQIPLNQEIEYPQYGKIYKYGGKIFILPWYENTIVVYELETGRKRDIDISKPIPKKGLKFLGAITEKNKMYIVPCAYDQILMLDMETEVMSTIFDIPEKDKQALYAWGGMINFDSKVVYTEITGNKIWEVDLLTGANNVYICDALDSGGAGICLMDNYVWIVPLKTEKILRWDKMSKTMCILNNFPQGYKCGEISFYKLFCDKNKMYLLPREANMILCVDESGEITNINTETEYEICNENPYDRYMRYANMWRDGEHLYLMSSRKGILYRISKDNVIEKKEINIGKRKIFRYGGEGESENIQGSLKAFIFDILQKKIVVRHECERNYGGEIRELLL